ncbi:hypothetical protein HYZ98_05050 [Candidatus Peregrinibacteria bacterium]|nr:hypothetical protein [Candidatus Peregrinibacteria bacterium]
MSWRHRAHPPEDWVTHPINIHAHSNASDGVLTIHDIDQKAKEWGGIIGITDHNTARAHELFSSPNILPGIEVKTSEKDCGVDVLLYNTREKLLVFCDRIVYPARLPSNPLFGPTRLQLSELLDRAIEYDCDIVIPHYHHLEGLGVLPHKQQRHIAAQYPITIELNGRLSTWANRHAHLFAFLTHRPVIASADSHLPQHYTSTYTTIPLPPAISPTSRNLFRSLRRFPQFSRRFLEEPTLTDTIAMSWQTIRSIGISAVWDYVQRFVCLKPNPLTSRRHGRQEPLPQTWQTSDEDDGDDF